MRPPERLRKQVHTKPLQAVIQYSEQEQPCLGQLRLAGSGVARHLGLDLNDLDEADRFHGILHSRPRKIAKVRLDCPSDS